MILQAKAGEVDISPDTIKALRLRYRSVDVESELLKAHLWLLRYPKRRPVNLFRFIDNWLSKAPAVLKPDTVVTAWWSTEERTINQGAAIGLTARPGESMAAFKDRIANAMKGAA